MRANELFLEILSKSIKPGEPSTTMDTHQDYLYHATSVDSAHSIASSGIKTHRPWQGTDQNAWPDGQTGKRSYFTDKAHVAWHFAPENDNAAVLRVRKDAANFQQERGTGDYFVDHHVKPKHVEIMAHDQTWHPISRLLDNHDKHASRDAETKPSSGLSKAHSPGQPLPPHPSKPRAPRPPTPYDPVEDAYHFADPYKFKPIRLKDLYKLHLQDKYPTQKIHKTGSAGVPKQRVGTRAPRFNMLTSMIRELKPT